MVPGEDNENLSAGSARNFGTDFAGYRRSQRLESREMTPARPPTYRHRAPRLLRRQPLRLGYVPLCDAAPLLMAQELGLFAKHGLRVELRREVGWATVRDKLIYRELDAAHAPAGMVFAATLGLGSIPVPCLTALVLNLQGNAITLSETLWRAGVRDGGQSGAAPAHPCQGPAPDAGNRLGLFLAPFPVEPVAAATRHRPAGGRADRGRAAVAGVLQPAGRLRGRLLRGRAVEFPGRDGPRGLVRGHVGGPLPPAPGKGVDGAAGFCGGTRRGASGAGGRLV